MANEYDSFQTAGLSHPVDYIALTGDMERSDTVNLARDIKGVNVSAAGTLKITTAKGTTITIHVVEGDNGIPPTRRIWATGGTAAILAGII